ncbi:CaiB/BaiF CoA-transferase family protein, partial [Streptomyces sp. NPDC006356]
VSLFEALAEWMQQPAHYTAYSGTQPPRVGTRHPTIAPYGAYTAADGRDVLISVQHEREWTALCETFLRRPELVRDPRFATTSDRVAHRDVLDAIVAERFRALDSGRAAELLDAAGVATAPVNDVRQFLDHPVLKARDRWRDVPLPGGETVSALLPPADIAGVGPRMDAVPALGEHTDRILAELGYSTAETEALRGDGIV